MAVFMFAAISGCTTVNSPITSSVSLSKQPLTGKFIWHDLLTDDPQAVREFYTALFGWHYQQTTLPNRNGAYTLIRSGDQFVGGMVELADPDDEVNYSRWLSYLSVADIDESAATTQKAGGSVLLPSREVGDFGWAAVVKDPQDAVLGLATSRIGDPDDSVTPGRGDIVWHELLAPDDQSASLFYQNLGGYDARLMERRGGQYHLLEAAGIARAGIVKNPVPDLPATWLVAFAVANPSETAAIAESAGGQVLIAPSEDFREGSTALLADPTGALLLIQKWPL